MVITVPEILRLEKGGETIYELNEFIPALLGKKALVTRIWKIRETYFCLILFLQFYNLHKYQSKILKFFFVFVFFLPDNVLKRHNNNMAYTILSDCIAA